MDYIFLEKSKAYRISLIRHCGYYFFFTASYCVVVPAHTVVSR